MTTTETIAPLPVKRPSLFSINDAILAVVDRFEDEGQEVDPEALAAELAELEGALEDKVANCISFIRSQEVLAQGHKEEAERLRKRGAVHENRAKRLKDALRYVLEAQGRTKIETARGTVAIAQNGGAAPIETLPIGPDVVAALDAERRARFVKTTYAWNVDALRTALANGEDVTVTLPAGATLTICHELPRGQHTRIR